MTKIKDLGQIATELAITLTVIGAIAGAFAVAFAEHYRIGDYTHDLALFVIGLGAVTFAANNGGQALARRLAADAPTTYLRPPAPPAP
jgi:hypothetical protein